MNDNKKSALEYAKTLTESQLHNKNFFLALSGPVALELQNLYPNDPVITGYMDEIRSKVTRKSYKLTSKNELKDFNVYTAKDLEDMDLKPPEFIIKGLLPVGVTILAAPSKIGKSWLSLDLGLSVAEGKSFLGHQTNKSEVLYLALEDSYYRLNNRIDKLLKGGQRPQGLMTTIECENMMNGLLDQLDKFLEEHRSVKLVIIDTFQKIKPPSGKNSTAYEQDYKQIGELKGLSTHYNIGILLVHHTKKSNGYDGDVFEKILGSTALQGATDSMFVITKEKRTDETATLLVTGRDISQQEICIRFDKEKCLWINEGTAEEIEERKTTNDYESNPLVITIRNLIGDNGFWEGTLEELHMAISKITKKVLPETGKALSTKLRELAPMLVFRDNIEYRTSNNPIKRGGRSVRLHSFQKYYPLE